MNNKKREGIPIKFPNLLDGKKGREGFYVRKEENRHWLCHLHAGGEDENGFTHCIGISEDLYSHLIKENNIQKKNTESDPKKETSGCPECGTDSVHEPGCSYYGMGTSFGW